MRDVLLLRKTFAYARDRRVGNRLVEEEDEFLLRSALLGEIENVDLETVEYNSVALIEQIPVGRRDAISHFAAAFDERVLTETQRKIQLVVIRSPE